MPIHPSIKSHICPAGSLTNLWEAPSPGYIKLFVTEDVHIEWDKGNEHPPWYWKDGYDLVAGWNQITYSPPSAFTIFRVNPERRVIIQVSESG